MTFNNTLRNRCAKVHIEKKLDHIKEHGIESEMRETMTLDVFIIIELMIKLDETNKSINSKSLQQVLTCENADMYPFFDDWKLLDGVCCEFRFFLESKVTNITTNQLNLLYLHESITLEERLTTD